MHLGHASTYLLAWLQARSHDGRLILRMEDVDRQRCKPEFAEAWRQDLQWLGLSWDEEAPAQSTRDAAYLAALESLREQGLVFGCQCTRRDMEEAVRAPHQSWGAYPGTCVAAKWPLDGSVAVRLAYPEDAFVLRRADGAWSYSLAVVVDDRDQGVTHVLRGQDLAPSEAPQAFLHQALGNPPALLHACPAVDGSRWGPPVKTAWIAQHFRVASERMERPRHLGVGGPRSRICPDHGALRSERFARGLFP